MDFLTALFSWFNWPPCSGGNCVDVQAAADGAGVVLTSTLGPDMGAVRFTHQEWAEFIDKVKAGEADDTVHPDFRPVSAGA